MIRLFVAAATLASVGGALSLALHLWSDALDGRAPSPPLHPGESHADGVIKLAWDSSPDARVTGYRIKYGKRPGRYDLALAVGQETTAALGGLERDVTYYIVVVAVDGAGNESPPSNEVTARPSP